MTKQPGSTASLGGTALPTLDDAVALARRGDLAAARTLGETLLVGRSDQAIPLHAFLGMLACQMRDFAAGIEHLRAAHRALPDDLTIALNLVNALGETGDHDAALAIASEARAAADPSLRLRRLRAYHLQSTGAFDAAAASYRILVDRHPDDAESWNNLGNALAANDDLPGSIEALRRAVSLWPDNAPMRLNLANTLIVAGHLAEAAELLDATIDRLPGDPKPLIARARLAKLMRDDKAARDLLAQAVALDPADLDLKVQLGTELATAWQMDQAETLFQAVIAADPAHRDAHTRMALVLEHTNRFDALPDLIAAAQAAGVDPGAVSFTQALHCRRARDYAGGLDALARVADDVEPARRWQLTGQFLDQLGRSDEAFQAFVQMNRQVVAERPETPALAQAYRDQIIAECAAAPQIMAAAPAAGRTGVAERTPVFLVGFPRSGTTLLDTLLLGHPDVQVLEERPPLAEAEKTLGGFAALADAGPEVLDRARAAYFAEVRRWIDLRDDSLLVDKFPLHMNKVPLVRRLFPEAQFILALRHPCDVVLSCFITNFRPNQAMSNFVELEQCAALYDLSFGYWHQCAPAIATAVHTIRYEDVVADAAGQLRPLFDRLGLGWHDTVLDHRRTAIDRGVIVTASYAQVTEPIYSRAAGRWQRYRTQLEPVLPRLAPWVEALGYSL